MSEPAIAAHAPVIHYRKDYRAPDFRIDHVALTFQLFQDRAAVHARLDIRRTGDAAAPLVLDGEALKLLSIALDGKALEPDRYALTEKDLTISRVPNAFTLETSVEIAPHLNTRLSGLYISGGIFTTQCEAEGFRRMTYFPDRPDVLARYDVRIEADASLYPVLLSNGNRIESGTMPEGRHYAVWRDPFPKPSYLFALVAGDLKALSDCFVTASGRAADLHIWVREPDLPKCGHAMHALKAAMKWDEERFGLEYDLDIYNIVAVPDFNMGAMENKSLNIFNAKYVLASPDTATDLDYDGIESVIAHEYFHNWTGNRVTCRDWFQLSLKEGLTVYRDQEFTSDLSSRAVKRIEDVRILRSHQFPEDEGSMAHPVRPDSYIEINNFYTATVYNKGAEVIRMMATLLGRDGFRKGMDLYFARHDSQAVTCDDFVAAMEDANGASLEQFRLWYSQAGTPVLDVKTRYDAVARTFTMDIHQHCPPTPGQPGKKPMHIPVKMALVGPNGADMTVSLQGGALLRQEFVLDVKQEMQTFVFEHVESRPVPSLLREFSAPVTLRDDLSDADRAFLLGHDSDPFARWEAGQTLALSVLERMIADRAGGKAMAVPSFFIEAMRTVLENPDRDPALVAEALMLPSELYLGQALPVWDVEGIHAAREALRRTLATALKAEWLRVYEAMMGDPAASLEARAKARRKLKNAALSALLAEPDADGLRRAAAQFEAAGNMTDRLGALGALSHTDAPERETALAAFYERYRGDALVIDKWFTIQALSNRADTFGRVRELANHPDFTLSNPNRLRSLIGAFSLGNPARFHRADGAGYAFFADILIEVDRINGQMAARLLSPLARWRKLDPGRQAHVEAALSRMLNTPGLSRDSFEIVSKSLAVG